MEAPTGYVDDVEETEKTKQQFVKCSISFVLLIGLFRVAKIIADRAGVGIGSS